MMYLGWNCNYCGKPMLVLSPGGRVYCRGCGKSNGMIIDHEKKIEELRRKVEVTGKK